MKKKFAVIFSALIIIFLGIGYFIGDYFVNFALRFDSSTTPPTPPKAVANIADPNLKPLPKPKNFLNETWEIISADGLKLHATYFQPAEKNHNWAVLVHGYGRDQTFAYDYAEEYLKNGWNVLTPDLRCAATSEGKFLTMGYFESRDINLWAEKILERDPEAKIIFHGVSMGAATVLMAAAQNPKNLYAVVEDCGYTSAYEMFTAQLYKIFELPEFPIMNFVDIVSSFKIGVKVSDAAPIKTVSQIKVPVLFIHGDADKLVPFEMMGKLFDECGAEVKEKFIVEDAGHADAKNKDPQKYFSRVFEFLNKSVEK